MLLLVFESYMSLELLWTGVRDLDSRRLRLEEVGGDETRMGDPLYEKPMSRQIDFHAGSRYLLAGNVIFPN